MPDQNADPELHKIVFKSTAEITPDPVKQVMCHVGLGSPNYP